MLVGRRNGAFRISELIDNSLLLETNYDDVVRGLIYQAINVEEPFNDEVRNRLFNNSDLISVDIQRGRDHGLAPYWRYREICGLPPVKDFKDLSPLISLDNIQYLKGVYKSARDIDLYIGGSLEERDGGLFGPTFKCIARAQFAQYKLGDRFFYTHKRNIYPFTEMQLDQIKQFTFAKLLCLTTKITSVPIHGFLTSNQNNFYVKCSQLQQLNLLPWID